MGNKRWCSQQNVSQIGCESYKLNLLWDMPSITTSKQTFVLYKNNTPLPIPAAVLILAITDVGLEKDAAPSFQKLFLCRGSRNAALSPLPLSFLIHDFVQFLPAHNKAGVALLLFACIGLLQKSDGYVKIRSIKRKRVL